MLESKVSLLYNNLAAVQSVTQFIMNDAIKLATLCFGP